MRAGRQNVCRAFAVFALALLVAVFLAGAASTPHGSPYAWALLPVFLFGFVLVPLSLGRLVSFDAVAERSGFRPAAAGRAPPLPA